MSATVVVDDVDGAAGAGERPAPRRRGRGSALRVATRLARREVRRRPGRTALVALLVAVPVAGMVIAAVLARTQPLDAESSWRQSYGTADAIMMGVPPRGELPPGSRTSTYAADQRLLRTREGRRVQATLIEGAFTDRLTDGMVRVDEGRAPTGPDEVLLAPSVAGRLGVSVGDTFEIDRPFPMRATVTGLGVFSSIVHTPLVALGPGRRLDPANNRMRSGTLLIDLPDAPFDQARTWMNELGLSRLSPQIWPQGDGSDDTAAALVLTWIGGTLVLTVAGIVIAAAFATSARRQLTTLGQLAANGAPPLLLRRVVAMQGLLTGAVGTTLGIVLAGIILVTGRYRILQIFGSARDGYRFAPIDLVPIVLIALIVSTVAATVPGRAIGRVPVLRALAGRRPQGRVPTRVTGGGAIAFVAGCLLLAMTAVGFSMTWARQTTALSLLGSLGCIAVLLGMCALTPAIVERLEGISGRLPGEWRLAARSLGRRRSHTAAMVAAVCATAALTLASSALVVGRRAPSYLATTPSNQVRINAARVPPDKTSPSTIVAVPDDVVAAVRAELPGAEVLQLSTLQLAAPDLRIAIADRFVPDGAAGPSPGSPVPDLLYWGAAPTLADDAALATLQLSDDVRRQLRETGAVMAGPRSGRTAAEIKASGTSEPVHTFAVDVVPIANGLLIGTILITPESAQDLGLLAGPTWVALRTPAPLDEGQIAAVNEVRTAISLAPGRTDGVQVNVTIGDPEILVSRSVLAEAGLALGALLLTLLVIAAGLALAAAETRDERDLLVVAGAGPRTISRMSARKAVLVVLGATLLAVLVGLIPLWVTMWSAGGRSFASPWRNVGVLVVLVPVVTGLATRVGSVVALRVRPVRTSTMANG